MSSTLILSDTLFKPSINDKGFDLIGSFGNEHENKNVKTRDMMNREFFIDFKIHKSLRMIRIC